MFETIDEASSSKHVRGNAAPEGRVSLALANVAGRISCRGGLRGRLKCCKRGCFASLQKRHVSDVRNHARKPRVNSKSWVVTTGRLLLDLDSSEVQSVSLINLTLSGKRETKMHAETTTPTAVAKRLRVHLTFRLRRARPLLFRQQRTQRKGAWCTSIQYLVACSQKVYFIGPSGRQHNTGVRVTPGQQYSRSQLVSRHVQTPRIQTRAVENDLSGVIHLTRQNVEKMSHALLNQCAHCTSYEVAS